MSNGLPVYPFDSHRHMGTVAQVEATSARINLPLAGGATGQSHHGYRVPAGEVGEFVVIECDDVAIFGRILEVRLPEKERLAVEPELGSTREVHPVGRTQLLATLSLVDGAVLPGIARYPRLGSRVFSAHPDIVRWIIEQAARHRHGKVAVTFDIAALPDASDAGVSISPEQLFGRHCAVFGATGGGKSWTLARILEEALSFQSKMILLDATGEFFTLNDPAIEHVFLGSGKALPDEAQEVCFPYREMIESDLFAIFKPSGQSRAPKLRSAMKSLKLARAETTLAVDGVIVKANKSKRTYEEAYQRHVAVIEGPAADFDVHLLARQIGHECVYPAADYGRDTSKWGDHNGNEYSWCVTLLYRIEQTVTCAELACVFSPGTRRPLPTVIDEFISDENKRVLRISLQHLPFANDAREIVANAIGRCLLASARSGRFRERPTVVILDEAHQFLDKKVGEENSRVELDAFGLIAKEGRKFGLTICIATQRPRDIPEDVLSQIGTLVVHRLINEQDRRVVERASGEIDRSAAEFLPTLGPGEAVIIGVDIPVPLSIKIEQPTHKPDSMGPNYQKCWLRMT